MHALVIANGEPPSPALLRSLVAAADWVVCADGGANTARQHGLRPHVIVGDLDSITGETREHFHGVPVHEDRDENATDLEKAVRWAIERGARRVTVVAALGRRLDHTVGNLGVLAKFQGRAELRVVDDVGELQPVGRELELAAPPGTVVSLLPLTRCEGIETGGLRYALRGETLELGMRDGTSNVVETSPVRVRVARGHLLLYRVHESKGVARPAPPPSDAARP